MKRLFVTTLLSGLLATVAAAAPSKQANDSAVHLDRARVDAVLNEFVKAGQLVGVSALVFENGQETYFGAFGLADREDGRPMRRDTLVQIYSMTKPVTGVALMTLFDQGKFQLDDPIEKYAPEFANLRVYAGTDEKGRPVYEAPKRLPTIRDLMRHTAGLVGGNEDKTVVGELFRQADPMAFENTLPQMARKLGGVPLLYQPGTRWLYSPSVDVQAFLVERISGQPYDEYLQQHVLDPLRMTSTRYVLRKEDYPRMAALYARSPEGEFTRIPDEQAYRIYSKDWPMKPGGWGLVSTLDDYMRFARMLVNEGELDGARILKPQTVRLMATNAMPPGVTDTSWLPSKGRVGFGIDFAVRTAPPANAEEASGEVGEFFWDGFANTLFWVDPENELTAVLFTQFTPFGKMPLHKAFRDAVYHNDPSAAAPPAAQPGSADATQKTAPTSGAR